MDGHGIDIMHISEGVLSGPVLISGAVVAAAGVYIGLKKLDLDQIAQTGILSAAFFVASLIHVPIGPASIHLILNGVVGLLLGWAAFPAIMAALLLQAMMFQFGGITTLGVNTLIMAVPAVTAYYIFSPLLHREKRIALLAAFGCGAGSVFMGALLAGASLMFTEENFMEISAMIIGAHVPVMVVEGFMTAFCIAFLQKVKPEMLPGHGMPVDD